MKIFSRAGAIALICICTLGLSGTAGTATAADLIKDADLADCNAVTHKKQLVLERRALGGDKRAQFMLAYCSWHADTNDNESNKIAYTYFWTMLANCERRYDDLDEPVEGLEGTTIPSVYKRYRKPRDFQGEFEALIEKEGIELQRIKSEVEDKISSEPLDLLTGSFDLRREISEKMVARFNAMGMSGLVPLAMMRNCLPYPDFQQRYVRAAIWQNIAERNDNAFWINDTDPEPTLDELASRALQGLGPDEVREIARFASAYGLGDVNSYFRREAIALGKMGRVPVEAVQFALGAFRKSPAFGDGIPIGEDLKVDGLYGAQTATLVKESQKNPCVLRDVAIYEGTFKNLENTTAASDKNGCFGRASANDEGTGWLTPLQSRALICRAAVKQNDPFSYMYLGYMFINGFGYAEDIDRALFSVQRAIRLFADPSVRLQVVKSPYFATQNELTRHYRQIAEGLEQDIYWAAANKLFGSVRPSSDAKIGSDLKEAVHRRLPRANYDEEGLLCQDEVVGYQQELLQQQVTRRYDERFATLKALNDPEPSYGKPDEFDFPLAIQATSKAEGGSLAPIELPVPLEAQQKLPKSK